MTTNNDQLSAAQIGELSTIRNILMGQQMNEYESQFHQIDQQMATMKADFSRDLAALGTQTDDRFQRLEKDMNDRFDRLEKLLADHVARLDKKSQDTSRNDKNKIGKLLADISKKLIEE